MFEFFSLNRTYRILQGLDTAAPGIICRIIEQETITFLFDIFFAFFQLFNFLFQIIELFFDCLLTKNQFFKLVLNLR